jgi:hypothetical protein
MLGAVLMPVLYVVKFGVKTPVFRAHKETPVSVMGCGPKESLGSSSSK